tara:strand:+ start:186 stop:422 length:237 start_codon:yes stop_codon:yes gene_type:complete
VNDVNTAYALVGVAHRNFAENGSETHAHIEGLGWMKIDAISLEKDDRVLAISAYGQPAQFLTVDTDRLIAIATDKVRI